MNKLPTDKLRTPEDRSTPWIVAILGMLLLLGITPGLTLSLPLLLFLAVGGYFGLHLWRSWRFRNTRAFHSVFLGRGEFAPVGGSHWIYHVALARAEVDMRGAFRERARLSTELVLVLGEVTLRVPRGTKVGIRLRGVAADLTVPSMDGPGNFKLNLEIRTLFGVVRVEEDAQ